MKDKILHLLDRGVEWMDEHITLKGCDESVLALSVKARQLGAQCANRYWDKSRTAMQNLERLGIGKVREMSPMEELAYRARAVYDPNSASILLHQANLLEMLDVQRTLGLELFTREDIMNRLLSHECFHHLEETQNLWTIDPDPPAALRDVAAHAFANTIFGDPPCQALDLLWLAVYNPEELDRLL